MLKASNAKKGKKSKGKISFMLITLILKTISADSRPENGIKKPKAKSKPEASNTNFKK